MLLGPRINDILGTGRVRAQGCRLDRVFLGLSGACYGFAHRLDFISGYIRIFSGESWNAAASQIALALEGRVLLIVDRSTRDLSMPYCFAERDKQGYDKRD